MSSLERIKQDISNLPQQPGVYQYYDKDDTIIYVGKAKNLRRRVAQYFTAIDKHQGKMRVLVKRIVRFTFVVVETEMDALLLENNLIKKYQPRYNVLLKDDKSFPWICVKKEPFPRVFSTRRLLNDGSTYYGPYASVRMMRAILELIENLYPIRNCKLNLSDKKIAEQNYRVCLNYHIKKCLGPCVGKQSAADYEQNIQEIHHILKGNIADLIKELKAKMMQFAEALAFEKARMLKERIDLLLQYRSKSLVVNPKIKDVDVCSYVEDEQAAYVNYMRVLNGAIVQTHTIEIKKRLQESPEELLQLGIGEVSSRFGLQAPELVVPFALPLEIPNRRVNVPKIGDKKHLLDLSERNARYYLADKNKKKSLIDPDRHSKRILETLQKDLRMQVLPTHIECFDNSNFQGAYPVAAMVMFKQGKPYKKGYRHYNIKTVVGPDDFSSMAEIIHRRYKRLLEEEAPLPQLIIIDGGKGQLSAALKSLEALGLRSKISIIGIAKRLEEIFFPGDSIPIYIDKRSESLKLIQHARNEAHRFGITHHRHQRDKDTLKTELTAIKGIGQKLSQKLLQAFGSVEGVKNSQPAALIQLVGPAKAKLIRQYFEKNEE